MSTAPLLTRAPGGVARSVPLVLGGLLFALGNLLHPLEHSEAAERSATWTAAHVLFSVGALLLAFGLSRLQLLLEDRAARITVAVWWTGLVLVVPGGFYEGFIAPELGAALQEQVESSAAPVLGLAGAAYVLGPLLLAAAVLRRRSSVVPRRAAAALAVASLVLLVAPGLPEAAAGALIIASTALTGVTVSVLGARSLPVPGAAR